MLTLCSPMLAFKMLTPIAVTEKAEVTTGCGGGDDGVTTVGRRLGRHASITFGHQPKASGKDTGLVGRRPDLKADV